MTNTPLVAIVDDDETVGEAIKEFIETAGLSARAFSSAEAFLDSDFVDRVSCLVADVQMPGLDGLQLYRKLVDAGHNIPVIFITAFPNDAMRTRALQAGAICFLKKPFDPAALLERIRSAVEGSEKRPDHRQS